MLSKKAKYAIHALVYLAREKDKGPILISEISKNQRIPKKFLETILLDLKNTGFVSSKKGKGGGYYLIKDTEEVNLADVLRCIDGAIGLIPCATHQFYEPCDECEDEELCGIRKVFHNLRNETVNLLKNNTLQQILDLEKII